MHRTRGRSTGWGIVASVSVCLLLLLSSSLAGGSRPGSWGEVRANSISTTLTIFPDGTVSTAGILSVTGTTYLLLAPYTGSIADERNGSTLDGGGNTLTYSSGTATVIVYGATNVTVRAIDLSSTVTGVEVLNSSLVVLENNTILTSGVGIEVLGSTLVTAVNNTAPSTKGFGVSDSSDVRVENNDFYHSTGDGVDAFGVTGLTLVGNDFSSAAGVGLSAAYLASAVVRGNRFDTSTTGVAASLDYVTGANLSVNNLSRSAYGAEVANSAGLSLWNNSMSPGSLYPYVITLSSGVSIIDTTALSAGMVGVYLAQDVGITLLRVDLAGGVTGVEDLLSTGVQVVGSRVGGGASGIFSDGGSDLTITGSDLSVGSNGLYSILTSSIVVRNSNLSRTNYPLNLTGGTHDVLVEGSNLDGALIGGAYLNNVSGVTLSGCTIRSAAQYAVDSVATRGLSVVASNLSGSVTRPGIIGVETFGDTDVSLLNDTVRLTQSPLVDTGSDGVRVVGSDFSNATGGLSGISLYNDQNIRVAATNFYNDSGQGISGSSISNLSVSGSNLDQLQFDGLNVGGSTGISVTGNTFDNEGGNAVFMAGVTGLVASGNRLNNDSYAFFLPTGTNEVIVGNTALNDRDGGLATNNVNGFVMAGNNFSNDSAPGVTTLFLLDVGGFSVTGNTLASDQRALYVAGTSRGVIVGNRFLSDNLSFDIEGLVDAQTYHNDFLSDGGWTILNSPTLTWDNGYPAGGNHWSNYTGVDRFNGPYQNRAGSDGIGDTPMLLNRTNVDRYPLMTPWTDHVVVFSESGLPLGAVWGVTFNGTPYLTNSTVLTVVSAEGVATAYQYTAIAPGSYRASPSTGNGTIGAGRVLVTITFALPTFPVVFQELGLPAGTPWGVTVNGSTLPNTGSTVGFNLTTGRYNYSVRAPPGFIASPARGAFAVVSSATEVQVSFSAVTFVVEVVESGLPTGVGWSITLAGSTSTASTPSLSLSLSNGSYPFSLGPVDGFTSTPSTGTLSVAGGPVTVYISFLPSGSSTHPGTPGPGGLDGTSWSLVGLSLGLGVVAALGWLVASRRRAKSEPPPVRPPEGAAPPT
ncbi:MAG: right-handed parallel beta-helix repeat-containing protein [Thermoplasmata archaeon]|nr:right-handed parallel beta-helix repeat-containing protein [Thermoplasmata archaeon]